MTGWNKLDVIRYSDHCMPNLTLAGNQDSQFYHLVMDAWIRCGYLCQSSPSPNKYHLVESFFTLFSWWDELCRVSLYLLQQAIGLCSPSDVLICINIDVSVSCARILVLNLWLLFQPDRIIKYKPVYKGLTGKRKRPKLHFNDSLKELVSNKYD